MVYVKVQYDSETRTFRLVDQDDKTLLDGDAFYDLAVPTFFEEVDEEDVKEFEPAGTC